jgi:amidase
VLDGLGHDVGEASPRVAWPSLMDVMQAGLVVAARPLLTAPRRLPGERLEAVTRGILREAQETSAMRLLAAFEARHRLTQDVGAFFSDHDVLVTPTLARLPAPHGTLNSDDPAHGVRDWLDLLFAYGPFTALFNITGQPALSLPLARSLTGLPIGVHLVARHGAEHTLVQVAAQLEAAMAWHSDPVTSTRTSS